MNLLEPTWLLQSLREGRMLFVFLILAVATGTVMAQDDPEGDPQDDPAARNLFVTGSTAYEQKDYEAAIDQWNRLLESYPNYSRRREAKYFIGRAWLNLDNPEQAATELRELRNSIPVIADYKAGPSLLLFLGYSEFATAEKREDPVEARTRLLSAVESYEEYLEKFSEDDLADQVHYFLGKALERANSLESDTSMLERATAEFRTVLDQFPDSTMASRSLFELAGCLELSGEYEKAITRFQDFVTRYPDDENRLAAEFHVAENQRLLGVSRENAGDANAASQLLTQAVTTYTSLAGNDAFPERDVALFQMAWCQSQLQQYAAAADAYATLANSFPESRFVAPASLLAGQHYFSAGNTAMARQWLETTLNSFPELKSEATHWLCRVHFDDGDFATALQLASDATEDGEGGAMRPRLLMDRADALYRLEDRRAESAEAYRALADEFPNDPLAADALYYSAFSNLGNESWENAIRDVREFEKRFPQHAKLPASLEVLGEAAIKTDQLPLAQSTFENLIAQFPDDDSVEFWETRVGWAMYRRDQLDTAVQFLSEALVDMADATHRSEAWYVIGACQMRRESFSKAADALEQALEDAPDRTDADELRMMLARAYGELNETEKAREIANAIAANPQGSAMAAEAAFRVAELEYEAGNYADAGAQYTRIIDDYSDSPLLGDALYGRAWSRHKLAEHEAAIVDLTQLIDEMPDHPSARIALLDRAAVRRVAGDFDGALQDIATFEEREPTEEEAQRATYERGMCHALSEQWQAAIDTFEPLVATLPSDHPQADNVRYELAWAWRKLDDPARAATYFADLADTMPDSEFAAEANFHVGEAEYDKQDYTAAAARYRKCLDLNPSAAVGERAIYKLGWCAFEQEDWEAAHDAFRDQVDRFPEGALRAVGLSMLAESLFQNKKHSDAVTAYKVAVPAVREAAVVDESVRVLTPLHAAQSANQTGDHAAALAYAQSVVDEFPDSPWQPAALFELGMAHEGLGDLDKAIAAWTPVAENSIDKLGARARAMIGEAWFKKQDYNRAINEFKAVVYGYPTVDQKAEIDPWRLFAAYEAARCYYLQINDASGEARAQLIANAITWFEYVVDNFPDDELAADARKQLDVLSKLN